MKNVPPSGPSGNVQPISAGWWLTNPSEKYEFVSWDDYSHYMEKSKMFQTTNQSGFVSIATGHHSITGRAESAHRSMKIGTTYLRLPKP